MPSKSHTTIDLRAQLREAQEELGALQWTFYCYESDAVARTERLGERAEAAEKEAGLFESLFESRCKLLEGTKRLGLRVCEQRDTAERELEAQRALLVQTWSSMRATDTEDAPFVTDRMHDVYHAIDNYLTPAEAQEQSGQEEGDWGELDDRWGPIQGTQKEAP